MTQYSKGAEEMIDLGALVDQVLDNEVENENAKVKISKQQRLKLGAPELQQTGVREPKLMEAISHETEIKPGDRVTLENLWKKPKKDLVYKVITVKGNIVTAQQEGSDVRVVFPKLQIDKILRSKK